MRVALALLLTAHGLLTLSDAAWAQVTTFVAQTIIVDGKNFVAGPGLGEAERRVAEVAAKAPEGWDAAAQGIFRNMIFVTASQLATVKAVGDGGQVALPIVIRPADISAAVLTWDTSIDNDCITPTRIAKGEFKWSDVLLFSGDYEKLLKATREDGAIVRAFRNPTGFAALADGIRSNAEKSGRRDLVPGAIDGKYLGLQQFLMGVKADLLIQKDAGTVTQNAGARASKLGLR